MNIRAFIGATMLAVVLLCLVSQIQSQSLDQSLRDRKVRITAPTLFPKAVTGRVTAQPQDTLVIEQFRSGESNYLRVPVQSITWCEVQNGKRSHVLTGALIGTAVGGTLVAIYLAKEHSEHNLNPGLGPLFSVAFTGSGTLVGALTGLLIRTDRYEDVPLSSLKVSLGPVNGSPGLSLSISF